MCALVLLSLPATLSAFEVGMGLAVNDNTVFLPVKITDRFMMELSYLGFRSSDEAHSPSTYKKDVSREDTGLGIYGLSSRKDNWQSYYGVRFLSISGAQHEERGGNKTRFTFTGGEIYLLYGWQYFLTDTLSLGGNIGYYFRSYDKDLEGARVARPNSRFVTRGFTTHANGYEYSRGTRSDIIFRYMF